jgi:hypothetical protein
MFGYRARLGKLCVVFVLLTTGTAGAGVLSLWVPQTAVPRGTQSLSGLDDPPPGRVTMGARNFSE